MESSLFPRKVNYNLGEFSLRKYDEALDQYSLYHLILAFFHLSRDQQENDCIGQIYAFSSPVQPCTALT